ncbi:FAD/NAD-binding domain-containing protein [Phellopilus nigrolimitatus]|nr:FAD/NAD-binding domain-containing protein [Phellopilus nigrolimitatus]
MVDHAPVPAPTDSNDRQTICIVGAGAAGLAALHVLTSAPEAVAGRWSVTALEQRHDVGGTWLPDPAPAPPDPLDPDAPPPLSPLYESITANLPHPVMRFPGLRFPPGTPLFPRAPAVAEYLRAYADRFGLRRHIRLRTTLLSARWTGAAWAVRTRTAAAPAAGTEGAEGTEGGKGEEEVEEEERLYDRLVIANGHYRVPFVPPLPGLAAWQRAGRATHAAWYRAAPAALAGKKVLVVGGGPTGADLAAELAAVCATLVHAVPRDEGAGAVATSASSAPLQEGGNVTLRGRAVRFSEDAPGERTVHFADGRAPETDIDHVFLATGYVLAFPFLAPPDLLPGLPPSSPLETEPLPTHLHCSGAHVFPLAMGLFPLTAAFPPDRAAFVGLPLKVAPFPLCAAQARAVARVFSAPGALDVPREREAIIARAAALSADPAIGEDPARLARAWPRLGVHEQFAHRDALHAFAGARERVPRWVPRVYESLDALRAAWRGVVARGEEGAWCAREGESEEGSLLRD